MVDEVQPSKLIDFVFSTSFVLGAVRFETRIEVSAGVIVRSGVRRERLPR
jgi:hypothetical protein